MTQRPARMSPAVKVVTTAVLVGAAFCLVSAWFSPPMAYAAGALMLIIAGCYLTPPIGYELEGRRLTVFTHLGSGGYGPVVRCSRVERSIWWACASLATAACSPERGFT